MFVAWLKKVCDRFLRITSSKQDKEIKMKYERFTLHRSIFLT